MDAVELGQKFLETGARFAETMKAVDVEALDHRQQMRGCAVPVNELDPVKYAPDWREKLRQEILARSCLLMMNDARRLQHIDE